jgi:hypothetical protein
VVPPRSDRVSRAPPYSRTPARPCPYGAVTRYGAPFQTLPVRKAEATGLVRVRSSLLTESRVDVLSSGYLDISVRRVRLLPLSIHDRIPPKGWVAPFGDLGITGRSPLPRAFRSVPRPSSPLGAKASTRCPSRARPRPAPRPRFPALSWSPACGSPLPGQRAPAYLHTHARARPIRRARPEGRGGLSCHARFTVTTRFTMSKRLAAHTALSGARADLVCPGSSRGGSAIPSISPTPVGGPGPIRTADLTLIRRAL